MIETIRRVSAKKIRRILSYFFPLSKKKNLIRFIILIAVVIFVVTRGGSDGTPDEAETLPPTVFVSSVSDIRTKELPSFVGTVRAVNEAHIQSEVGGRVTSVQAEAGNYVSAGTILATLENASEEAALLQAQGAYEAALANAAQSNVSSDDAQQKAITAYKSAYTTVRSELVGTVDTFFGDPTRTTPGVRVETSRIGYLNTTRHNLESVLAVWQSNSLSLNANSDMSAALSDARSYVQSVVSIVDIFIEVTSNASPSETLDGASLSSYTSDLIASRATLDATITALDSADAGLKKAQIGGSSNTDVSLANAQVKQALGTLRSAQANYEKTVFRSPISGTVNSLRVNVGDFISAFTEVAEVANNDALQISIFVGEADIPQFAIGDTVTIGESATGTVTSVSPAIDSITQKSEVRVATESANLTNGSAVSVKPNKAAVVRDENTPILVPITAVKFTAEDGNMFTVEDGMLVSHPVKVGRVTGPLVHITEGITAETTFVLDARGLTVGQHVEAVTSN